MQTLGSEARREQVNHVCENAVQCLGRQSGGKASRSSRCTRSLHLISPLGITCSVYALWQGGGPHEAHSRQVDGLPPL
jgi:hypothetical protein